MTKVNTDVAYKYIRGKILTGKYAPGMPLKSKNLASEIGISRTPIRDSLRQLEADGLVVIRPRLGTRVRELDIVEFTHLCQMRLALEVFAAGLAAKNSRAEDLDELRSAVQGMENSAVRLSRHPGDMDMVQEFQRDDLRFHLAVLSAAQNPVIKKECTRIHLLDQVLSGRLIMDAFSDHTARDRGDRVAALTKEHQRVLRGIEKGDVSAARSAMEEHLMPLVEKCMEAVKREGRHRQAIADNLKLMEI